MKLHRFIIFALLVSALPARADADPVFEPVAEIFRGLSAFDYDQMRASATDDFLLLEHGEIWDMEFLISKVQPSESVRRNFFAEISRHVSGNMALINYWNKAIITTGDEQLELVWLESVVLVQQGGAWKLQQMHSTRVAPEMRPQDIDYVEVI